MPSTLSIQKKITYSFSAFLVLLTATAIIFYILVHQVEKKLYLMEVINNFLNLTLEMRRYEKNYFLYHLREDYEDNIEYLDRLIDTIDRNKNIFLSLQTRILSDQPDVFLITYKEKMNRLHILNHTQPLTVYSPERELLQDSIRESGKSLTLFAEEISAREKEFIQKLLRTSRSVLLSSTGAMVFLFFILITLIREKIVSSLKLLKEYTRKVAHGEMVDPPENRVEEEIHSLFQAFARMNNELRFRQRQMVQSEKLASLGTLLAGVAHELNNPLSNISTSAQILREEIDNPEKEFLRTMVRQIDEQTDKARDIVKTLLEFSRTREFKKQEVLLREVIAGAVRLLRSEIPSGIQIELDIPENLPVTVDKQRMQQVFLNLIKNGVDACGREGKIWISAREFSTEDREEVEILVSDNGPGIPPEDLKRIFDPFYTSKDVGKGSGLGLFIVHDIIESHGGEITVDSRLSEGTTFIIWIPGGQKTNDA
jgi:two-component system, NtrC family, sensor kinase